MDRFEEAKLKIKDASDLVELVQGFVALQRRGRYFVGLCPFHAEKTPSFTVYPDSDHYKCYGCGKAGDVFSFLMERDGVSFREAMETLAERAGVPLDGVFRGQDRERGSRVDVHRTLAAAREFLVSSLAAPEGRAGREYLASRGLLAAAETFGIGFHPLEPGALGRFARERRLPIDVLVQAGLLGRDGRREPFAGRVVFPIVDERGRVVGFGGRVLPGEVDDRRPKYVNSPESPFFNKRRLLYGLRQVKDAGTRRVIVVEGYTDVVACHVAGLTGVVATLGTALTVEHARLLERWATDGVVLLFDGDAAGRRAAERAFRELVHTPLRVQMALLPEGSDPADLAGDDGAALEALIEGADDALTMWLRLLRQRLDLSNDADFQRAVGECQAILAELEDPARRHALQRNMARHLDLDERALNPKRLVRRRRPEDGEAPPPTQRPAGRDKLAEADLDLVACLLRDPALLVRPEFEELRGDGFATPRLDELLAWIEAARRAGAADRDTLGKALFARTGGDPALSGFLAEALDRSARMRDPQSIFLRLRQGRQFHYAKEKARQTCVRLREALAANDQELAGRLQAEYLTHLRASRETPAAPPD